MTPLLQYAANRLRPTARAVAEFLGPDGIVDVAAGLAWPKAAAAWAPGLALYPVEAETGLLADKPDYLARNLEEAARRQQVQRMNEQAAAFRKLAGERTQAFNASQGQRLRGLVDQYNGAELPLLEALSGQDLRSPVIQRRAGGGAIKRMARYLNPEFLPPRLSPLEAVKEKGGNWAGVGLDEYIDDVAGVQRRRPETRDWANNQLKRYIKTYLGTAEDPMLQVERDLQMQGLPGMHMGLDELNEANQRYGARGAVRNPPLHSDNFHIMKTGRRERTPWEQLADGLVEYTPRAGDVSADVVEYYAPESGANSITELLTKDLRDPAELRALGDERSAFEAESIRDAVTPYRWLDKDPAAFVRDLAVGTGDDPLGLVHLLDYLDQTGYDAERMKRVTFPDAVRATTRWSQELAKKRAGDPRYLLEGTAPLKEYDNGWQWVDVQSPEALKLEGDEMGHCVGGYCDAVEQGGTKIYSLRDPDGRPHFTVEIARGTPRLGKRLSRELATELSATHGDLMRQYAADFDRGNAHAMHYAENFPAWLSENDPRLYEELTDYGPPRIRQLKPAGNSWTSERVQGRLAKDPEYRARITEMAQDLVQTMGPWGDVLDIGNAGLIDTTKALNYVSMPSQLRDQLPQHLPIDELKAALSALPSPYLTTDELVQAARGARRSVRNAFNKTELARLKTLGHDLSGTDELTAGEIDDLQKLFNGE